MEKVLHHYLFRTDTTNIRKSNSNSCLEGKAYYLSEPMRSIGNGTFEVCGGVIENSLEGIADGIVINLFSKYAENSINNGEYINDKIILHSSLNNEVKEKPHISVDRESIAVKGASSDVDDLLKLQMLLKEKIGKRLQQH